MASAHKLYLIDGSGYIFRAFHALPMLTRPDGTPVNAVLGFTNMLVKLLQDVGADRMAVIFDKSRISFRNEIYPEYKAHRPDAPPELVPQFALIREATRAFNVPSIELEGFEADDLIASYAKAEADEGGEVVIVSSDKDLMQLIRPGVTMMDPIRWTPVGPAEVMDKFGVAPEKVVEVQALCGDSVDNVPGVRGIGPKTAAELINHYGTVDVLLQNLHEIKQPKRRETLTEHAELARISRRLVELRADVPLPVPLTDLAKRHPDADTVTEFLSVQGFRSVIARLGLTGQGAATPSQAQSAATKATSPLTSAAEKPVVEGEAVTKRYELVQDLARLDHWIARAREVGTIAVDTETSSLSAVSADLVGISLAVAPGEACYIPVGHVDPGTVGGTTTLDFGAPPPPQIPLAQALERLAPLLADPAVLKIGHNIKYDLSVLARHGVTVAPFDDTMLLSYVLDGGLHGHGMDELAELLLSYKTIAYKDVAGSGKTHIGFARVALDKALDYAAEDADITLRLHRLLKPRLAAEGLATVYETIERPLIPVIARMEQAGITVDPIRLRHLSQEFAVRMHALEREIHGLAGVEFNVGSPKQLAQILFEKLGLTPTGKKGKTGEYSTASDVLEPLAEQGHALPAKVLEWRQIAKLKSTYADALVEQINPETKRVHTSFSLAVTTTGRLSSSDPNLQNIPVRDEQGRKIRAAFIAAPGHKLVSIDYSQIELRLLSAMGDIPELKTAFAAGIDIHALTASQVFGVPMEGMDKELRRQAKAINFGIIYGMSAFGLAKQIGVAQGEAQDYIRAYFNRFPGIRDYMDRTKEEARAQGFVRTWYGRKCQIPGIQDKNQARRGFAERQAINAPLQGTAADIIKRAMIQIAQVGDAIPGRMLLQVHDELLFEIPEAAAQDAAARLRAIMERAADLPGRPFPVPLVAEAGIADSWAEAH